MHAPFPGRSRVLRLAAIAFALGLMLSVAPLPSFSFVATASAQIGPLPAFQPLSDASVAVQQAAVDEPIDDSRVSAIEDRAERFDMIGVALPDLPAEPVLVRVLDEQGAWSEWNALEVDPDQGPDANTAEAAAANPAGAVLSEPLWVGAATGYEVSVGDGDAEGVEVAVVREHTRRVIAEAVPFAEAALAAPFPIQPRSAWGARAPKNAPSVASGGLKLAVVHHTASSNTYTAAQVPGIIRGMQAYHMDGNGWSDLGYNFIVDKFGGIWEGRAGGTSSAVVGAHASGFNTGSVGVSVIGSYEKANASAAALEGVSRVVGYRLQRHGANPNHRVNFTSGGSTTIPAGRVVNLPRVIGHKDVGSTSCPGRIYGNLGSIRNRATDWYALMDAMATPSGAISSVKVSGNRVDVIGWAIDPDVSTPARVHVVVAGRLSDIYANGYRPDVGRVYPGHGDHRGYSTSFTGVPAGNHRVCVTAINQGEGNDKLIGCRDIVVK